MNEPDRLCGCGGVGMDSFVCKYIENTNRPVDRLTAGPPPGRAGREGRAQDPAGATAGDRKGGACVRRVCALVWEMHAWIGVTKVD